ncbi:hypothetical protein [Roseovarius pelagicus]|uniref:FlgN protein n=1 Tax=Roseovarius pelagicus TaxID=2980108 RepID=A0ABY6DEP6_9RHOB|nr:hypothetical protein [Roseovarius pelagicus]UXX82280.1 hypothetical protein N7U68_14385 [Roseovarius pelagicus]
MTNQGLSDLQQITDALLAAEQAKMHDILQREAQLRRALGDLDRHRRDNLDLTAAELAAPRALGADIVWQGWVGRTRTRLNTELARVLVTKADKMAALHRAFGRNVAMDHLINDARRARDKAQATREEATRAAQMIICPDARYR